MSKKRTPVIAVILAAAAIVGVNFADDWMSSAKDAFATPATESITAPSPAIDVADDYFTVVGEAQRDYEAVAGQVDYCELDALGRAGCAFGELTYDLRQSAQQAGRQSITVDPSGWRDNAEVQIDALPTVEGSKPYSGWFWNRSHLVADSLGGDATRENLVTGTRTQNVGSTQLHGEFAGGMAHTEVIARDYLSSQQANGCPLYYAATPNYDGEELVPRTVTVDIQSCDQVINERVIVSNTAQGWEIDYATGQYRKAA
ncbi:DNA-entry nuclease [Leucobacter luti]|uniref:DNA-entry nuclease n=1 Tax=Leucobacter luti TaxID=340320 RepID=A0A4R6S128_9MICO|nr:DNA/RNA non-specific endonuclease [Leucobacter luti]TDP92325.1 DNA-entry nuclease [Leucobacter luti]